MPNPDWTYGSNPAESNLDAVRFTVGDVIKARPLLSDGEINYCIAQNVGEPIPEPLPKASVLIASAQAADGIRAKFSAEAKTKVGDVQKDLEKIAEAYKALAEHLRDEACKFAGVSFPALSKSAKRTYEQDTDLVQPNFLIDQFDNKRAVQLNDVVDGIRSFSGFF